MRATSPDVRCAIYTRKSVDERRNKDLSTLENQRNYCSAYIKSQAGQGWTELSENYDDGGFSGGDLKRPALARLREDIAAGHVDTVIVYKIDRLSRSIRDFVNLVAEFDKVGVSFVSITQAFDTSTSMGRLTLNVLLSFAQFERELTGERLRDWFAGARGRGLWTTDRPYGYAKANGNFLVPHPDEAPIVKRIYQRYCRLGSCRLVADELFADGIFNKAGRPWSASMVLHTIKHRVYRGELVHKHKSLPGLHEPIISEQLWARTHSVYVKSKWRTRALVVQPVPAMLKGLVFDRTGHRMHHTFLHSKGRLYRYYVAGGEYRRYGASAEAYMRFRASELEMAVVDIVDRLTGSIWKDRSQAQNMEIVRRHVERIDIGLESMTVRFRMGAEITAEASGRLGKRHRHAKRGGGVERSGSD